MYDYHKHINLLIERYPVLETERHAIEQAYLVIEACYQNGGKLLIAGNGGSAADAEHIVGELMKSFVLKRKLDPVSYTHLDVYKRQIIDSMAV